MDNLIQDIRWYRYFLGDEQGQHPSAIMQGDSRLAIVLQIKIDGDWTDIPIVDSLKIKP